MLVLALFAIVVALVLKILADRVQLEQCRKENDILFDTLKEPSNIIDIVIERPPSFTAPDTCSSRTESSDHSSFDNLYSELVRFAYTRPT